MDSRRNFLGKMATGLAGSIAVPSTVIGANDRIVVGYVGTGSQGKAHIQSQKQHASDNNIALAAVCDVYQKRLQEAKVMAGITGGGTYADHRKLLERKIITGYDARLDPQGSKLALIVRRCSPRCRSGLGFLESPKKGGHGFVCPGGNSGIYRSE